VARRFQVHANTVSLAYRRLEREGWVHARRGSGVYVRSAPPASQGDRPSDEYLWRLMAGVVEAGRSLGMTRGEMAFLFGIVLKGTSKGQVMVVEPELGLRQIVVAEVEAAIGHRVDSCGFPINQKESELLQGGTALVLPSKAAMVQAALPAKTRLQVLEVQSVPEALAIFLPAPKSTLVAICSHWPRFLEMARMMLISAGFDGDALVMRDTREAGWLENLAVDAVVCDVVTAAMITGKTRVICFRLLSAATVLALGESAKTPLTPTQTSSDGVVTA
jgi:hypothetical protein